MFILHICQLSATGEFEVQGIESGMQTASAGASLVAETTRHPSQTAQWGAGVVLGAAELAGQVMLHLGAIRDPGQSQGGGGLSGDSREDSECWL